ncbi:Crp/Fnr family transcriptional regulator [Sphingomonas daechungensis]|uniref:Crp/Fnr family transcriptional regulator n=1 Tax=Sphingomonas daechungensis TaxID=1176646 RepID=A0ABX6T1M0_9SPHN|nr:Crp/Fnr family transcriptional regulator [Sphingomonas daechungensis]QNP43727.1 Crp/Fnr family transcriptional regulator [Sphingomonas daechungensis]
MLEAHLKKLRIRDDISCEEEAAIRAAMLEVREAEADTTVVRHGRELHESLLLLDGWMARTTSMASGHQQISELQYCGDFVDLHGFTLKRLDHNIMAITACRYAVFPHERLRVMLEKHPHLARVYWLMTNVDAAIHREWTVSLGRRTAPSRMAHLFCEMLTRLRIVGKTEGNSFEMPLTQQELGDCLGLTSVHVNRTLQSLRRQGLIKLDRGCAEILDLPALKTLGEFDDDYLYLEKRPR